MRKTGLPYRYRVLVLLFSLIFVMYLDRLCISVAGPRIQSDLHLTPVQWGWVIGAFTLAYAALQIPSGALGDRIGPRRVLARIVLWWSAFTVATGLVASYPTLLAVRFLFGAGEAGAFPNSASAVSKWIPKSERARALSSFWVATGLSGIATPLIVVTIQQRFGWRPSFYVFGALGIIWSAIWYTWFRDTPWQKAGVTEEERRLIGVPAASRHAGVSWARRFRSPNFVLLILMYHFYCWGGYFYLSWLHTYLQVGLRLTEDQMKFASALPPAAGLLGVTLGGYLSDRFMRGHSLRFARCSIGSVSLIGSGILLWAASLATNPWTAVALITAGLGVMNGMLPVSWSLCVDLGGEHSGAISAAMNTGGQIGSFASAVCFGYLVERFGSYSRALMPLAGLLIVGGCLFAAIDPGEAASAGAD